MCVWTDSSATCLGVEVLGAPLPSGKRGQTHMEKCRGGIYREPVLGMGKATCTKIFKEEVNVKCVLKDRKESDEQMRPERKWKGSDNARC